MKQVLMIILLGLSLTAKAAPKKVLVVLSGETKITLKDGIVHPTGFYLNELMIPVKALIEEAYEPVFATPNGIKPTMDKVSDSAFWFDGDEQIYQQIKNLFKSLDGLNQPFSLAEILQQNLSEYAAILVPGGHAPMEDLLYDKNLGALFNYFHHAKKITALICHGPIALLSSLPDSNFFVKQLIEGKPPTDQSWIYSGYQMTSFSTPEEKQQEPDEDNALDGFVKFYPDQALSYAGGFISVSDKWQSHVVKDRELITAQNPMSDAEFTKTLIEALKEAAN